MIEAIKFASTVSVQSSDIHNKKEKSSLLLQRNDIAISEKYSEIAKTYAQVSIKQNSKLSFGRRLFFSINGEKELEDVRRHYDYPMKSDTEVKEYAKNNAGESVSVYDVEMQFHGMYSYPTHNKVEYYGEAYLNPDGSTRLYSEEEIRQYTKDDKTKYSKNDIVILGLTKDKRDNDLKAYSVKNIPSALVAKKAVANVCIKEGRVEEAIEKFPELKEYIDAMVNDIKHEYIPKDEAPKAPTITDLLASGKIEKILEISPESLPDSLKKYKEEDLRTAINFVENNEELKKWASEKRINDVFHTYWQYNSLENESVLERIAGAIITLGLTEALNILLLQSEAIDKLKKSNKEIKNIKSALADILTEMYNAKIKQIEEEKNKAIRTQGYEEEKEKMKAQIQSKFVVPFVLSHKDEDVELPNSVMLTGENPYVMQELIEWTKNIPIANFVKVQSLQDKNQMQKQIFEALEKAEETYEETGLRSIIFVNGMEDLLNPRLNSKANIAAMKDVMSSADEDYHSTIMFYSQNPKRMDKGSLTGHRVGLIFHVPIPLDSKFHNPIKE